MLRFDFDEIFTRREEAALRATAALLHRESLLPASGESLLDGLDENSHRHAFGVSEDLKHALRESIELIGNEAIRHLREVSKRGLYDLPDAALAHTLGVEALRYMYRLLFLFYIEARPMLDYAPLNAEAYRRGYGLERLRDLEMARLTTEESRNGYHLHLSIEQLFRLVRHGFHAEEDLLSDTGTKPTVSQAPQSHGFSMRPLDSRLFREDATPLLNQVKLRNHVLQRVLRLMSLSRPGTRRGQSRRRETASTRRGRISYAQLGINQLGAVYEALLAYRGFFAEEDLYEVKPAGKAHDALATAYFVPQRDLPQYAEEEKVQDRDENGRLKLRVHKRGTFVYRLAGRDRQKSASYYTPEIPHPHRGEARPARTGHRRHARRRHPQHHRVRTGDGFRRLPERGREPAGGALPGTQAARTEPPHRARRLRRRTAARPPPHRGPQRVRRRPEPGRAGTRRGLAVAERHPPRRPRAVVRLPAVARSPSIATLRPVRTSK